MIPKRPVSNRIVHHEVVALWPRSFWYDTVLSGPIQDWSWRGVVGHLERRGASVTVHRGRGRHRKKIYETERRTI